MIYKTDLHVHSKYSNKPSIWALRKINCPESLTTPKEIYRKAIENGMDYVTITDHNSIDGAMEIAGLPRAFVSSEITTYFPENSCKIHVVVLNISETEFKDILSLRQNVYELVVYLRQNHIVHFIAHPFYDLNGKLTMEVLEKMFLLFNIFEVKNGARSNKLNSVIERAVLNLSHQKIEELVNKHNLSPIGETPWIKGMVGGSDDHGGFFISRAYTLSRKGETLTEFLDAIENMQTWAGGEDGDPLTLSHSIYAIGYRFLKDKLNNKNNSSHKFINMVADRLFGTNTKKPTIGEKVRFFIKNYYFVSTGGETKSSSFEDILDMEARNLLNDKEFLKNLQFEGFNQKIFAAISHLANRILYVYTQRLLNDAISRGIFDIINSLSSIALSHLLISPYYISFYHQSKNKELLSQFSYSFLGVDIEDVPCKTALFTDTLHEINGVSVTIKRMLQNAKKQGIELVIITSTNETSGSFGGVTNFKSVGDFALPEYPELKMGFPPILDLLQYFHKEGFNRIHISTPGSMGLTGLLISKLLNLPITGTYHTDIPNYIRQLTDDAFIEDVAWNYMVWFYNMMDEVTVPSSSTRRQLIEKGLEETKVKPLPRWVDREVFKPENKDISIWDKYDIGCRTKFLYVGRISKEKNLAFLAEAFKRLIDKGAEAVLIMVGDGPFKEEFERLLEGYPVIFTGFKSGQQLCTLYASADVFVFPSTTDTFGNVVLEAQASGLPVIVTNEGGPKELMVDRETGFVIKHDSVDAFVEAMSFFLNNKDGLCTMSHNALKYINDNGIDSTQHYSTIFNFKSKGKVVSV
ncbi:MAG: glycosyltransferase [Candidatus Magnetoovum sp. WYHC-5]|nr:glycosyltransferase [Candidatus Magnetoovum sp. WYHC-5]